MHQATGFWLLTNELIEYLEIDRCERVVLDSKVLRGPVPRPMCLRYQRPPCANKRRAFCPPWSYEVLSHVLCVFNIRDLLVPTKDVPSVLRDLSDFWALLRDFVNRALPDACTRSNLALLI